VGKLAETRLAVVRAASTRTDASKRETGVQELEDSLVNASAAARRAREDVVSLFLIAREHIQGQRLGLAADVGDRLISVGEADDGEQRAEDLLAENGRVGVAVDDDGRLDASMLREALAPEQHLTSRLEERLNSSVVLLIHNASVLRVQQHVSGVLRLDLFDQRSENLLLTGLVSNDDDVVRGDARLTYGNVVSKLLQS